MILSGSLAALVASSSVANCGVDHRAQDDVAPFLRPFGIAKRRQPRRRLNQARDRRGLAERHVADVLAEEDPRCFGDAVNLERSALAERDVVQIQLEDLVLGEARFQDERHELFLQLPPQATCPA